MQILDSAFCHDITISILQNQTPLSWISAPFAHFFSHCFIPPFTSSWMSLSSPSFFLHSMYCRILMRWLRRLVDSSQLRARRCQGPAPPNAGRPLPPETCSFSYVDKWTEVGSSSDLIFHSLCLYWFPWPFSNHSHKFLQGFGHRLDYCGGLHQSYEFSNGRENTPGLEMRLSEQGFHYRMLKMGF